MIDRQSMYVPRHEVRWKFNRSEKSSLLPMKISLPFRSQNTVEDLSSLWSDAG